MEYSSEWYAVWTWFSTSAIWSIIKQISRLINSDVYPLEFRNQYSYVTKPPDRAERNSRIDVLLFLGRRLPKCK